jgi:hypothetical protein
MTHAVQISRPNAVSEIRRLRKASKPTIQAQMNQRISASGTRTVNRITWRLIRDSTVWEYVRDLFRGNPRLREIIINARRLTIRDSGANLEDVERTINDTALRLHRAG